MNELTTTRVKAPDITCGGCANSIKSAFGRVDGVTGVEVDVATKEVCITHDGHVDREKVLETLDRAGFPAE